MSAQNIAYQIEYITTSLFSVYNTYMSLQNKNPCLTSELCIFGKQIVIMRFVLMSVLIISCALVSTSVGAQNINSVVKSKISKDSTAIVGVFNDFLRWYKKNYKPLYNYKMVIHDSTGNYQVDISACRNFLSKILKSECVSDEYIKLWNQYFESQAERFKTYPQNEGPPEGFDMDLVLLTQEPDMLLDNIKKLKYTVVFIKKDTAEIWVLTPWKTWNYSVELSKVNNRWYIDYLSIKEPE